MYYSITSDTETSENSSHDCYRHLNIMKQMHIDGSSVLQNVNKCSLYFCKPTCNNLEHYLTLDGCSVNSSSSSVRNLGVLFDSNLSFESHVSSICKTAFLHLKNISKLRPMLSTSNADRGAARDSGPPYSLGPSCFPPAFPGGGGGVYITEIAIAFRSQSFFPFPQIRLYCFSY